MASLVSGMKNWWTYSKMGEEEWEAFRRVYLEEELRKLISRYADDLEESVSRSEGDLGEVSVPVRSGALRQFRCRTGNVFLSKDRYEDGDLLKVHLMVPASSRRDEPESWEPVCAWTFDSVSEMAEFIEPASEEAAS